MSQATQRGLAGWPLVATAALCVLAGTVAVALTAGDPVVGARAAIRLTARASVALFLAAFVTSAAWKLWPGPATRWLRRNRRYIGLSFAASHLLHLGAIVALHRVSPPGQAPEVSLATLVGGGLAYAFIAAMALSSFDRAQAWRGGRPWNVLHTLGSYYVWLIFANSYVGRAVRLPEYVPVAALVVGALLLRLAARFINRRSG